MGDRGPREEVGVSVVHVWYLLGQLALTFLATVLLLALAAGAALLLSVATGSVSLAPDQVLAVFGGGGSGMGTIPTWFNGF